MLGSDSLTVTHPLYLINTNIFVSSDFTQQIKLMFDLSLGCSCSVCHRRGHKRLHCKAIHFHCTSATLTETAPTITSSQHSSVWSETFPFSTLIYLLSVYSLCLSSTSISQLLQCPVLREFILSVNL